MAASRREYENKPKLTDLPRARVEKITREQAASIILKYEWLAGDEKNKEPLGRGVSAFYGLWLGGELIGANCLGVMGGQPGNICGPGHKKETVCIMRGACVPHAPDDAASYLTRYTCMQARKDFGWKIFFAYSDQNAGEIGVIYESLGWAFFGQGVGRRKGPDGKDRHYNYLSPDGSERVTSYDLNHDKNHTLAKGFGWSPELRDPDDSKKPYSKRRYLLDHGWTQIEDLGKSKWVWIETTSKKERAELWSKCEARLGDCLPYPRRAGWKPYSGQKRKESNSAHCVAGS